MHIIKLAGNIVRLFFRVGDQRGVGTQSAQPDEPNSAERRNATTRGNRRPTLRERAAKCAAGRDCP